MYMATVRKSDSCMLSTDNSASKHGTILLMISRSYVGRVRLEPRAATDVDDTCVCLSEQQTTARSWCILFLNMQNDTYDRWVRTRSLRREMDVSLTRYRAVGNLWIVQVCTRALFST